MLESGLVVRPRYRNYMGKMPMPRWRNGQDARATSESVSECTFEGIVVDVPAIRNPD
jgi:hypothetical protein